MPDNAAAVLPTLDLADVSAPRTAQLTASLSQAIRDGRLPAGARLPPTRDAAHQLGIGRNTVVDAYADLTANGLLESRGRLGTFVGRRAKAVLLPAASPPRVVRRLPSAPSVAAKAAHDWRLGQSGAQLLPLEVWRASCREAGRHLPPSGYGDPKGLSTLREAVATWLRRHRGTRHEAAQIVITQGAGNAVELLARCLVRRGDLCAVESPGYPRALAAFEAAGGNIVRMPVDEQGAVVHAAFAAGTPSVLHLTPAHQYPLGGRLSGSRRAELAALVSKAGALVIENEYDHEFIHEGQNHASLAAAIPEQAALVSTFAKSVSPALRIGFIAAPQRVADALAATIEADGMHASWPVQVSLHWMLASGELQRHLRRARRHHASQRDTLLAAIGKACPGLQVRGTEGGLHLVLTLGHRDLDRKLAKHLRQQGVMLQTVADFGGDTDEVLMGYGHMQATGARAAAALLASACAAIGPRRSHRP
jgi:GntR family transcriptional regulator / MocR family aminotransferase